MRRDRLALLVAGSGCASSRFAPSTNVSAGERLFDGLPCHRPKLLKWGPAKLRQKQPSCYHWLLRNARRSFRSRQAEFTVSAAAVLERTFKLLDAFPPSAFSNATALAELVCRLGLNDEVLRQFPSELVPYYGTGLHMMQYPTQLGRYLAFLATSPVPVRRYVEIGARWGGTFIAVAEVLRRTQQGALEAVAAVDPMGESPLLKAYSERLQRIAPRVAYSFLQQYSTDEPFKATLRRLAPTLVFIDGDHSYKAALSDHLLAESAGAKLIAHHDIVSDCCESRRVWQELRAEATRKGSTVAEFDEQYSGVRGRWLGIGVVHRSSADRMRSRKGLSVTA